MKILIFLMLFTGLLRTSAIQKAPPKIIENELRTIQAGKIGVEFKLICPIESELTTIYDWYKDGESVSPGWSRYFFKRTSKILKIRPLLLEDSGFFECKGVNGFGSQIARMRLIVVDDIGTKDETSPESSENNNGRRNNGKIRTEISTAPILSDETKEQSASPIYLGVGTTIRLKCSLKTNNGRLTWLKDGKLLGDKIWKPNSWTLVLSKLEVIDSGSYECLAKNSHGSVSAQTRLNIGELEERGRPELKVLNVTNNIREGDEVVLTCVVSSGFSSSLPPHVKWLKKIDEVSENEVSQISSRIRLIPVHNSHVIVIQENLESGIRINETEEGNGFYVSKLIINKTEKKDEGTYLCLAANSHGYTFRESNLLIISDPESSEALHTSSVKRTLFIIVLILASCCLTLLISALILTKLSKFSQMRTKLPPQSSSLLKLSPHTLSTSSGSFTIENSCHLAFSPHLESEKNSKINKKEKRLSVGECSYCYGKIKGSKPPISYIVTNEEEGFLNRYETWSESDIS